MIIHIKNNVSYLHFNGKNYELTESKSPSKYQLNHDLELNEVNLLMGYNLPRNVLISCEGNKKEATNKYYLPIEYINFLRINNTLSIVLEANYWFAHWQEQINLLSFVESLSQRLTHLYQIKSTQTNLFEEGFINLQFELQIDCNISIKSKVELLNKMLINEHKNLLSYETLHYKISLSHRHKIAGKSLLHYLYHVMEYKKLSDDLTLSVSEHAHLVCLELKFPKNKIKQIKKAIRHYGLILKGERSIDYLFNEHRHCRDLNVALNAIQKRISFQNENVYNSDMTFLSSEEETVWLKSQIGECLVGASLIAA
ncbi:MAG: hypothetical protein KAG28_08985 [Cocleimonas sp.]|nr:hypothetical protein [Cocleimonas sp.]